MPLRGLLTAAVSVLGLAWAPPLLAVDTPVLAFTTLTDSPDPVVAGETLTIAVTITNSAAAPTPPDDNDSTGTILAADLTGLPITYQSETFSGAGCSYSAPTLSCSLGTIADAGGSITGNIVFGVAASAADASTIDIDWDLYSNEIASPGVDGDTSTTVTTEADLAVTALAPVPTGAVPGTNLVYNVRVANSGPSDAAGVSLTISSVTGLAAPTVSGACSSLPCDLTTIASGGQKDVTLTYAVPDDFHLAYPATDPIEHTVTVTSSTPASTVADDRTQDFSTPVTPQADLSVTLSDGLTTVVAGQAITYTATISSAGPSRVDAVRLTGALVHVLSPVIAVSEGWFNAADFDGNWSGLDLASGEAVTWTLSGFVSPAAATSPLSASVTVQPRSGIDDPDTSDTADDSNTALTRTADLRITKTNGADGVVPAQIVPYTIVVSNAGPSDVTGATVADTFDATRITAVSWNCGAARMLTSQGVAIDGEDGVDGLDGASAVAVSADGKHVYATGFADNGIAVFARAAADGALTWVEAKKNGGGISGLTGAAGVAISPDGKHVYVVGATDSAIVTFSRNAVSGALTFVEVDRESDAGVDGMSGAQGVAVAPDGRHVYVASGISDAVVVYARNPTTGALTWVEYLHDNSGGVDGLDGARGVAVSPDGRVVVVASEADDAVASFLRDSADGTLTFVDQLKDNVDLNGLDGASAVAFGPYGFTLYATGAVDNALVAFSVDGGAGTLSPIDTELDSTPPVDGLAGARGVTVSPDGRLVFVGGAGEGKIAIFERVTTPGPTFGQLDFAEVIDFTGALAPAMSPAGEQLYVVASAQSSLGTFTESGGGTCDASGSGSPLSESVDLPAGSFVTFDVQATVSGSASGTLVNTATVTAPVGVTDATTPLPAGICLPSDTSNNSCTDSDLIGLEADISVSKTGDAGAVPGNAFTYQVVVANQGPSNVNGVTVTDADLTDSDFVGATWTCAAQGGANCALSGSGNISEAVDLPAGGSVTFTISLAIATDATGAACPSPLVGSCVENTASAALPIGYVDPTTTDLTTTLHTPIGRQADLRISKTVSTSDVDPGDVLEYQIVVTNCGPSDVTGATVQDTFPSDYGSPTWTCVATDGSCSASGSGNLAELVDLDAGAPGTCAGAGTAVFSVTGTLAPDAEGVITNIAKVVEPSGVFDPTQGNNTSSVAVLLSASAALSVVKDDGMGAAVPGEEVTYSITVSNAGPDNAELVQVQDVFAAILRDVRWTCDSTAPPLGTLRFVEEQRDGAVFEEFTVDGLAGTHGVVVAPDPDGPGGPLEGGLHVYATGLLDNSVVVFDRDPASGALTFQQKLTDGDVVGAKVVDGLEGAIGIAIAPNGTNVYVTGQTDNAVAVFVRNSLTGALTFQEVVKDGDGGTVDGLAGALGVAVSPDGEHVYVTGKAEDALAVFERRKLNQGTLQFQQVIKDGDGGTVDGLNGASQLAISADGAHVYVASATDDAVAVFARDNVAASGTFGDLAFVEALQDGDVQGAVTIDRLDEATGVAISPDGRHVYVSSIAEDAISIFSRDADSGSPDFGKLTFLDARYEGDAGAGGSVVGLDGVESLAVSPDGEHLYSAAAVSDAVAVFQRSKVTGALKYVESRSDGVPAPCTPSGLDCPNNALDGATSIALSPDGSSVYVAAREDSTLAVFERAGAPPAFAFVGGQPFTESPPLPVRDNVDGVDGLDGVSALAVSPDGAFVFSAAFAEASLVSFHRDPATGDLTFVDIERDGFGPVTGLAGASAVIVVENHVYVVSQSVNETENALVVFTRDTGTGMLTFEQVLREGQGGVSGLFGAAALAASPDGRHVYVASRFPGAVGVFTRDVATGHLTMLEALETGVGGVTGIQGAYGVTVSSDGEHVYVAASVDDSIGVFARNTDGGDAANFGRLTQIGLVADVPSLVRPIGITASPDPGDGTSSRNIYVTGHTSNSLAVFARNADDASPDFGQLSLLQTFVDGQDGVDGLAGARSVVASSDGKQVYVAGENDDALAVFARESVGGTLVWVERSKDGVDGVDGLDQAYSVAVIPNGRYVYVAGFGEDAIAAFARASGSRCTGSGVGNIDDSADIAAGGQVVYTATGRIDPAAIGILVNEVTITVPSEIDQGAAASHPAGVCDDNVYPPLPTLTGDDVCRDVDALSPRADLMLVKTDGDDVAIPGEELTYTITISNDGPSNVVGATVYDDLTDVFPAGASWTCVAAPSGVLTFLASYADGAELPGPVTLDGLEGAGAVAVSPDAAHLYVSGLTDDAITAFAIDISTGDLTWIETVVDGVGGVDGLDGPAALALSPDGDHLYVASQVDDTLVVFERNADPLSADYGKLTPIEIFQDAAHPVTIAGATLVSGLDQPVALALDPVGDSVYVAAANSSAVVVFARANDSGVPASYGRLTFLELQMDEVGGVDGLAGASAVAVSPDGANVYATGANEGSIAVFARDGGTGALLYLEKKTDGVGAVDGMASPRAVAVSGGVGSSVYVAGAGDDAVAVFKRDPGTGTLSFVERIVNGVDGVTGLAGADAVAVSHDGFHVYAAGGAGNGLVVLRREESDEGRLTFVESQRDGVGAIDGLAGASGVALEPGGQLVFATGRLDDAVAVFRRPTDSSCNGDSDFSGPDIELTDVANIAAGSKIVYYVTGVVDPDICDNYPCTAQDLVNVAEVTLPGGTTDPDGGNNQGTDTDALSPRVDLSITKTDGIAVISGLAGARDVAVSPDGAHVYAVGSQGDGVIVFARDVVTGDLSFVESERDGVDGVDGLNGASAVLISPDGEHVYVAGASDNAVAVFARDAASGELDFLQIVQSGQLGVTSMLGPNGIVGSGDGAFVYVAAANSSAIAQFARDNAPASATFGRLTFVGAVRDGFDGVDGLALVRALALSPGGAHLYATGVADSSIAAFERDAETGELTFLQAKFDGVGGVTGIAGATAVAISPGGAHVYVAGSTADAVAHFSRVTDSGSADFGKLTFVGSLVDGVGGIDGLAGAASVRVVPDPPGADGGGQHVYVAGLDDDAVAVFSRDTASGALTFVAVRRDGVDGIEGVAGAAGLAISPNAAHVYVAGSQLGSVAALARDWDSGTLVGTGDLSQVGVQVDGGGTVAPGTEITYVITVTNHGPSAVRNAIVTDVFPGQLESVSWSCFVLTPGAACLGGLTGAGDLSKELRLPPGGIVRIEATGTIKPGVTGTIVNTATVTEPIGVIELDPSDNSATDGDTVLGRVADLEVTKVACTDPLDCDGSLTTTAVPGTDVLYRVRVDNLGPSDAEGALVVDVLPEALVRSAWVCDAEPVAGLLDLIEVQRNGDDLDPDIVPTCGPALTAVSGLAGARAVALSADGLSVYVAGATDDAISIFRRDLRDGTLQFVDVEKDGAPLYNGACTQTGSVDGLDGVTALTVSPDGKHVYAVAEADDAISTFSRASATGALTFVQFLRDGVGGVNGLGNASGVAISPDGAHLYTAAASDNGVGVFARNASSGQLTFLQLRVDGGVQGQLTLDGLAGASAVAVSPDGAHVYVTGALDDGVAAFSRSAGTGLLTFVESEQNGLGGVTGLGGASAVVISPDGRYVYVAGADDDAVAVFARSAVTGQLTHLESHFDGSGGVDGMAGASGLTLSPDGAHLYVAGAADDGVAIFLRDLATGRLSFVEAAFDGAGGLDGLAGAVGLQVSPDGDQVYVAAAGENALGVLARRDGSRCAATGFGDVVDTVDLVAGGSVTYWVTALLAPAATGTLTNVASVESPPVNSDPLPDNDSAELVLDITPVVDLDVSKDDGQTEAIPGLPVTYQITIANNGPSDLSGATVEDLFPPIFVDATWSCSGADALGQIDLERQLVGAVEGLDGPYRAVVAPDPDGLAGPETGGAFVYVASRLSNAITVFSRDLVTGDLVFVDSYVDGVDGIDGIGGAGGLAISPDGRHLYATGATDAALAVFEIDTATGHLTPVEIQLDSDPAVDGLAGASSVVVSRDGTSVYVASESDDAVAAFARDPDTGTLVFVDREKDGFDGLEIGVIAGATSLAVTPDGTQLLVVGSVSDSLAVFDRDLLTGVLEFREVFKDGVDGIQALDLPQSVVVSPGGGFVYVAALADDAIAIFGRDDLSGAITYLGEVRDGVGGFDGLDGVRSLALGPDGLFLYAAGYNDDSLVLLRRNGFTGALTPLAMARDGVGGVDGLDGARGLAVAPDGAHVYVVGEHDDALSGFARVGAAFCAAGGVDDILDTVDIGVGGSVTYVVTGTVVSSATGDLINTVTVDVPPPGTNVGDVSATDIDTLTPVSDLSILKDDSVDEAVPGTSTLYVLTVANTGPSDAPASLVTDTLPAEILSANWLCNGSDGGSCAGSGSGDIAESVNLPAGASVVFSLSATIDPAAVGTLANTATVAPAAGVTDPELGNNSSTDTDALVQVSDLSVDKVVDDTTVLPGDPIEFTITVTNLGPSANVTVQVIDLLPAGLGAVVPGGAGWACGLVADVVTCDLVGGGLGALPPITITATAPLALGTFVNVASATGPAIDDDPTNNSDIAQFTVEPPEPPVVMLFDTVPETGDAALTEMETVALPVTAFEIHFSEEVADPPGDSDPGDVTNPSSYRLLEAGVDGLFSTVGCGSLAGDDGTIALASVGYVAATSTATVTVTLPPVHDGLFELIVCDAIVDLDGLALDGDGDGLPGGDAIRHFRTRIDNPVTRSHFDFASDLAAWTFTLGAPGDASFDPTQDWSGFPLSGALHMTNTGAATLLIVGQCVPVVVGETRLYGVDARVDLPAASDVMVRGRISFWGTNSCVSSQIASDEIAATGDTGGVWTRLWGATRPVPVGAVSAAMAIEIETPTAGALDVWLDALELMPTLFADGFEGGDTSRWAVTVPPVP